MIEELACIEFKTAIYKNLGYIKNQTIVKDITFDTQNTFYSSALADILEAIQDLFEEQSDAEQAKDNQK